MEKKEILVKENVYACADYVVKLMKNKILSLIIGHN